MFSLAMLHVVVARYEKVAVCRTVIQCTLKFSFPMQSVSVACHCSKITSARYLTWRWVGADTGQVDMSVL